MQGYAIGAGFQLALSCDLRVVSDDAQFSMKESALGLVPDLTGTKPLVEAVGYARALEICATARMVGAAEAVDIGLATTAVPPTDLDATVADLVGRPDRTRSRVRWPRPRRCCRRRRPDLDEQRRLEREAQVRRFRELAPPDGGPAAEQESAMSMMGMADDGAAWRSLRSDRSVVNNRIDRGTVRRVLGLRPPAPAADRVFLALTVVDAGLVVVTAAAGAAHRRRRHPQGRRPAGRSGSRSRMAGVARRQRRARRLLGG